MNLHESFTEEIQSILKKDEADALFKALETPATVSVRRNVRKTKNIDFQTKDMIPWCRNGFYLSERVSFTFDPLFQAGLYYVQDASSMIIQETIHNIVGDKAIRYLDLCAAPGGKTTAAIDALNDKSLVVANEIMNNRAQILRENIIKWGFPNCVVTNNDPTAFSDLTHYFDVIATDVPCSGEGMFRKDEEAINQWNPGLVKQCADRQQEIISNIWNALRPGGYLIYSTCTYNRMENEEMIDYIIKNFDAESIKMPFPEDWKIRTGIDTPYHCYRFMPHITKGEGLFLSVIRKADSEQPKSISQLLKKQKPSKNNKVSIPKEVNLYINNPSEFNFSQRNDTIIATPQQYSDEINSLSDKLRIIYSGVHIATIKGKDLIPTQALALSTSYNKEAFNTEEVDYSTAISYLRGESININQSAKGINGISYNGNIIGFVKNLGNRANNLYPKEWRIKSTYLPSETPNVL